MKRTTDIFLRSVILVITFLLMISPVQAAEGDTATLYSVDILGDLWAVEVPSGASEKIGSTGFNLVTDLAINSDGELFATTGNYLISLNPLTGTGTLVGPHSMPSGIGIVVGLDFTPDGILYGTTQGDPASLVSIDASNGAATVLYTFDGLSAIGDVTVAPDGNLLGTFFPGVLVSIDPATGATTEIGSIDYISTLDFEPESGILFGIHNDASVVIIVDPSNADIIFEGSVPFMNFGGSFLTLAVDPKPGKLTVAIDIKPGSEPNCINNRRMRRRETLRAERQARSRGQSSKTRSARDNNVRGVIPVAIFGSNTFDVRDIDPASVSLESLQIRSAGKSNKLLSHYDDINDDGYEDLVFQADYYDGVFADDQTLATVTGTLYSGVSFQGSDSICIVPSK